MSLATRFLAWWDRLFVSDPIRPVRLRRPCPICGKSIAVVASSNMLWGHKCKKPATS